MDVKDAGKLGGERTKFLHGLEHFKKISKFGVEARKIRKTSKMLGYKNKI
jgi:hypothetical protein